MNEPIVPRVSLRRPTPPVRGDVDAVAALRAAHRGRGRPGRPGRKAGAPGKANRLTSDAMSHKGKTTVRGRLPIE